MSPKNTKSHNLQRLHKRTYSLQMNCYAGTWIKGNSENTRFRIERKWTLLAEKQSVFQMDHFVHTWASKTCKRWPAFMGTKHAWHTTGQRLQKVTRHLRNLLSKNLSLFLLTNKPQKLKSERKTLSDSEVRCPTPTWIHPPCLNPNHFVLVSAYPRHNKLRPNGNEVKTTCVARSCRRDVWIQNELHCLPNNEEKEAQLQFNINKQTDLVPIDRSFLLRWSCIDFTFAGGRECSTSVADPGGTHPTCRSGSRVPSPTPWKPRKITLHCGCKEHFLGDLRSLVRFVSFWKKQAKLEQAKSNHL